MTRLSDRHGVASLLCLVLGLAASEATGIGLGERAHGPQAASRETLSTVEAAAAVGRQAAELVLSIKDQDLRAIRQRIHPVAGLRFSPYAFVSDTDLVFSRDTFPAEFTAVIHEWGTYDGRGNPIRLSFADYWRHFVYSHSYEDAPMVGYNHTIGTGNTPNNAASAYPGSIRVEYHFPNTREYPNTWETLNWGSLRLVFLQYEGEWFLAGIIHDQWTI